MHASSALESSPPKATAFLRSAVAEFIDRTFSKWQTDFLNVIFLQCFKFTSNYFCVDLIT
jgi:hypothetical protein